MSNHSNSAVIISADARLKRILLNNTSKTDKFEFSLEDNIANLASKPKSDAYIYDVELSNNNLDSTITAITDLKNIISTKPLILIGRQSLLSKVLSNKEVESMVAKTINKPISSGQLQLAISSSLLKPHLQKHPTPQSNSSNQRRIVVAALSMAFISVSALAYFKTKELPSNQTDYSEVVTKPSQNSALLDTASLESANETIAQLNQSALLALEEGRLAEPANNNVIYYLNQIKKTDPYNTTANQTHKKTFALLEASYIEHSSRGDDRQTKNTLNKILEFEPYNHKYAQLLRELKEKIYLAGNDSANENIQNSEVVNRVQYASVAPAKITQKNNELPYDLPSKIEDKSFAAKDDLVASINEAEVTNLDENVSIDPLKVVQKNIAPTQDLPTKIEDKPFAATDGLVASVNEEIVIAPMAAIKPAEILQRAKPDYPKVAAQLNYEGWVEVEYQIDAMGDATNIRILDGERITTFKNSAIKAIKNSVFSPSVEIASSRPILSEPMSTKFNFTLD